MDACGGGRRRIQRIGGCAERAAGQVLIVSTAPVENERASERNGKSFGREAGVSHDLRRLLLPLVRNLGRYQLDDMPAHFATSIAGSGEKQKGMRGRERESEMGEEKEGGRRDRSTPLHVHAEASVRIRGGQSDHSSMTSLSLHSLFLFFFLQFARSRSRFFAGTR